MSLWIESWTSAKLRYFDRLFWVPATRLGPKTHPLLAGIDEAMNQRSSQQIDFLDRAGACSDACRGRAGEPSITLAQISPRVRPPRDMPTTTERLRARWARTGEGPALEAQLRAAEAELARRERARVERSRARDAPEPDATTRRARFARVARGEPRAAHPDARRRGGSARGGSRRHPTRRATRARRSATRPPRDARASDPDDDEVRAMEAGCVEVSPPTRPTLPPITSTPPTPSFDSRTTPTTRYAEATTTSRSRCATGPSTRFSNAMTRKTTTSGRRPTRDHPTRDRPTRDRPTRDRPIRAALPGPRARPRFARCC